MEVVVVQGSYMVYVQSLLFSHAPKNLKGGFKLYRSAFGQWLDPLTSYPSSPSPKKPAWQALGSSGRKRERARERETRVSRVSPSRAPVFSCALYFQAPLLPSACYAGYHRSLVRVISLKTNHNHSHLTFMRNVAAAWEVN